MPYLDDVATVGRFLEDIEWAGSSWPENGCTSCGADHGDGHDPGCEWLAAIRAAERLARDYIRPDD